MNINEVTKSHRYIRNIYSVNFTNFYYKAYKIYVAVPKPYLKLKA